MWYHAIAYYGSNKRVWFNMSREAMAHDVVIPFVGKQVASLPRVGVKSLFNFASVDYVTVLKSTEKLTRPARSKTPIQLSNAKFLKANEATHEFLNELRISQSAANGRSLLQMALMPPENTLFVVMKFHDRLLDSAYEGVYKPLGIEAGFAQVVRVDEIQDSGNISQQIIENIAKSRVVIADLSGERPNCYFEAGFAQALGKPIIFTVRKNEKVHFDLAGHRFIEWDTESSLRKQLKQRFEAMAAESTA